MYAPWTVEVTLTVITQLELGAIEPSFKVTVLVPLTAVSEAEAPQPDKLGETGSATLTFGGRSSVRMTPVRLLLGSVFLIVIESRLTAPAHIVPGLKLLVTVGDPISVTVKVMRASVAFVIGMP